jgi:hypothetical protein
MALTQVQSQMLKGNSSSNATLTVLGSGALNATPGNNNTAIGNNASANTTGTANTSVGAIALQTNTSGVNNTAIGYGALNSGNINNSTAVGYQAGYNTNADSNTYVGAFAGITNTSGSNNVYIGQSAGYNTTGASNTFIGQNCGSSVTTGYSNVFLGGFNGNQNSLDMRTASNTIVLSDGGGVPRAWYQSANFIIAPVSPTGIQYTADNAQFYPFPDNTAKLGYPSYRWTVVYAVSGTINTSDANQKQQIRSLDEKEKAVAKRIKGSIKAFKWNDSVAEKGEDARIHVGVIAQEVAQAFEEEGLDPSRYGMFCSDTWYEVNGKKSRPSDPYTAETEGAVAVTQLGIRYDQLLSFVISAL